MSTLFAPTAPAYKGFDVLMGVYAIRHTASGRTLLGWSKHVHGTLNRHRFSLDTSGHRHLQLQEDWRRDGAGAFTFEVLDVLKPTPGNPASYDYADDLAGLEALWREKLGLTGALSYSL